MPASSRPGAVAPDAPLPDGWLIDQLGRKPVLLAIGLAAPQIAGLEVLTLAVTPELQTRYPGKTPGALYLIRPDQIIRRPLVSSQPGDHRQGCRRDLGGPDMTLIIAPNLADPDADPDAACGRLLAAHSDLSKVQSHALNARSVLILMNHLGGGEVWTEALDYARPA